MTEELEIDKETGLVKYPKYPCIKGEGLCLLRSIDTPKFECAHKEGACEYRAIKRG